MTEKRLILGTAGHIDHGKTALVKVLTGVDTDRLLEEKARGITIELGFADFAPREGLRLGVVDVPGHEGFIRNMLAGATGMDLVLMVVAADEGMMPQTREHLEIVQLLGVEQMVVALTKSDLVEEEWLLLVEEEVREALRESPYSTAPVVVTSTATGAGIEALKDRLVEVAEGAAARSSEDLARLPIDRAFTVKGTGTVVTGTLWSGRLSIGDAVVLQPSGVRGRVRGLQVHGVQVKHAEAGERTAVAITGGEIDLDSAERGQVLVPKGSWGATAMLTAQLRVVQGTSWMVKHGQRVRVHVGTSEVMARVVTLEGSEIGPGDMGWVQLRLERPLLARTGDRFVIRSYSPVTTIGGGVVAEALPTKRKKLRTQEASELNTIIHGDAKSALGAALRLASWRGIATDEVPVRTGLPPQDGRSAKTALVEEGAREAGGRVFDGSIIAAALTLIGEAVDAFHRDEPLRAGITVELLRQTVPTHDEGRLADLLLSEAVASGSLEIRDSAVSRPGYEPVVTERQRQVMDELLGLYRGAGLAAPLVSELPETLRGRDDLWPLLKLLERRGHLVALENELFLDAEAFSATAERVATELAGATRLGPSDFREIVPVTRKHLIPILSHFDQMGLTIRGPDGRDVAGMERN
jgi:selenocysteine-specific elongation factor|tara:strand:+ start:4936 stop:6852 length:1917 start_codon:yes stop_codon:yes gene_type:complete